MSFLHPWMLLALLAGGIPVIIHLINKQRAVIRPFPPIQFLLKSNQQLARRFKLRHLLLLLARVSLLLFLALAVAKPYLLLSSGKMETDRLPTAVVIIVDDSMSMQFDDSNRSEFEAGRAQALEIIDSLRGWDQVSLITVSKPNESEFRELTDQHQLIKKELQNLEVGYFGTDINEALNTAYDILITSELSQKRVYIITDMQRSGWNLATPSPLAGIAEVIPVDTSSGDHPDNLAIIEITYQEEPSEEGETFSISGKIANFGQHSVKNCKVELQIDETVTAASQIDIAPGERITKTFTHTFKGGAYYNVSIRVISENQEGLKEDNKLSLPLLLAREVDVLVVNGDPREINYLDETYYLENALVPVEQSDFRISIITGESLDSYPLEQQDVVILANMAITNPETVTRLRTFVEKGGGLLITSGSNLNPQTLKPQFIDLLPKPARDIKKLAAYEDPDMELKVSHIGNFDASHPILSAFAKPGGESLQSVRVLQHLLLEPTSSPHIQVLASFTNGAPAILEKKQGMGRIIFWALSADRDWTDFPIRTAYLPLVQRTVRYLGKKRTVSTSNHFIVGQKVFIHPEGNTSDRITVVSPIGDRLVFTGEDLLDLPIIVTPKIPGIHLVYASSEDQNILLAELTFSVSPPIEESDLRPLSSEDLKDYLNSDYHSEQQGQIAKGHTYLWPYLLLAVFLLLITESILSFRKSLFRRTRSLSQNLKRELP